MKQKKISILFLFVFFTACDKDKARTLDLFFTRENLADTCLLRGVKYCDNNFVMPHRLLLKKDYLIVADRESPVALRIYNAENIEYCFSKGIVGERANEIKDVWLIDGGLDDDSFWIYSGIEKSLSEFCFFDTSKLSQAKILNTNENFSLAVSLVWATDSTFMAILANGNSRYVQYNLSGGIKNQFGDWEELIEKKDISNYILADLHQGKLVGNSRNNLFVKASIFSDRIEILNAKDQTIISIRGPLNEEPKFKIIGKGLSERLLISPDNPYAYIDVCAGNQYFYALYSGYSQKDLIDSNISGSRTIFKFDQSGNLVSNYYTDISISSLAVSEELHKIYGITSSTDKGCLVVFNF